MACPDQLYQAKQCQSNQTWRNEPVALATRMSALSQDTMATFNCQNFSIIDVEAVSNPEPLHLKASDYTAIFQRLLIPTDDATAEDLANINALIYTWTWMHRDENVVFPGDTTTMSGYLQNILAIPFQFTVVAVEYSNYTVAADGLESTVGTFPLPSSMTTSATGGWSSTRLIILPWAGWLYIAGNACILLSVLVGIVWVLAQDPIPCTTGLDEIDVLRLEDQLACRSPVPRSGKLNKQKGLRTKCAADEKELVHSSSSLREIALDSRAAQRGSAWQVARDLRGCRAVPKTGGKTRDGYLA
jgi:hypothetical protein